MQSIRNVLLSLRVWLDTWRSGWHMIEATQGRFYVRYPDGKRSQPFYYGTARNYAKLFGGKVVHRATGREL